MSAYRLPMRSARLTVADFVAAVGERTPAPASGSATAVAAALAAALVELTARFSDEDEAVEEAVRLRGRLLELADEDADAYAEFMRSRSAEARDRTIDVPLELAEAAFALVPLADRLAREGNQTARGDAEAAADLARAAVRAATRLVDHNVANPNDPRGARARELAAAVTET
jgi:methenyltetrahydrofolate cyclohydrolase